VAEGILWLRLPLPMALDHVNVYALADADGWTLVDTGMNSRKTRDIWETALAGPLAGKTVARVLLTHHHPDHVGLVGWFQDRGAELLTTRTAWLYARMLTLDVQDRPSAESLQFYQRAGTSPEMLAKRANERPFNFADMVAPMPLGFTRVEEGETLTLGGRRWRVRLGQGHAPDHITLWSEVDELVIGGDQLLPGISPNIGVYPTEPEADPLTEWLEATARFVPHAREDQLVLPGHKLPFTGLPFRLQQMAENHHQALERLLGHLHEPQTAAGCFPALYKRPIGEGEYGLALVEAVAHLNCLLRRGQVCRSLRADGAWLWQAV
jgi:glyoxylase-like metal-dependent hydrolase (beta-lactamase superfamily II)